MGELLTWWSVRLAVAGYAARLLLDAGVPAGPRSQKLARLIWTTAWALYLLHVAAAFHFYHGWSHTNAVHFTARQTWETVGIDWGGGLYANYAFSLIWTADVAAWWWIGWQYPLLHRRMYAAVQILFAFMVFNATVVFGPTWWRWAAAGACAALASAAILRLRRKRNEAPR